MDVLARVVLHVDASDADALLALVRMDDDVPMLGHGQFELRNLVAHGQVGIEIVLAGEEGATIDGAIHGHGHLDRVFHGPGVQHRQHARHARADRTGVLVGTGPELGRTGTKYLALGLELGMDLKADDHFVIAHTGSFPRQPATGLAAYSSGLRAGSLYILH